LKQEEQSNLNKFKKILRLVLVLICIVYLVRFFYTNKDTLNLAFNLGWASLFFIIALQVLYYPLLALLLRTILEKCSGRKLPFFGWFKIFILSTFLNFVLSQVGNVYRAVNLKSEYNVSYTRYVSSFLSFAWMDLTINLFISALIILFLKPDLKIGPLIAWKILLAAIIVIIAFPILIEILWRKLKFSHPRLSWLHSKTSEVLSVSVSNIKDIPYLLKIFLIDLLIFSCITGLLHFCFLILNISPNIPTLAIFYALLKISNYTNITPGNFGIQEMAYGFLGTQMGIGMAQSVLVSAFMRIAGTSVLIVLAVIFGGINLLRHRRDYSEKQLSQ
jgi:uncharacterized membrane protein YbhN (UPF0104 family)